jgi:hypothetical protein
VALGSFWRLGTNFSVGVKILFKNSSQLSQDEFAHRGMQGDQIGRILAQWVIVYFWAVGLKLQKLPKTFMN